MLEWMKNAPCAGRVDLFFEEKRVTVVKQARKICITCGQRDTCLEYALENREVGIWAGTTTNQRAKILRSRRKSQTDVDRIV